MKARWIMSCVVLLCAAAAVGFILTEDNAQMAASGEVVVLEENEGYLDMESNHSYLIHTRSWKML